MSSRIRQINNIVTSEGNCVIYMMSRDQRVHDNHVLLEAQDLAIQNKLPLIVIFNLLTKSGVRSKEHFAFMLEGLKGVEAELSKYSITFNLLIGLSRSELSESLSKTKPKAVFFDFSPLRGSRSLRAYLSSEATYPCYELDTHNIIPVWEASQNEEFAAHTFRNKVHKKLQDWFDEPNKLKKHPYKANTFQANNWKKAEDLITKIPSNGATFGFTAGEFAAQKELKDFIQLRLSSYAANRNNPTLDGQSNLSPYLHFGMISSLRVALEVAKNHTPLLFKEARLARSEGEPTKEDSIDAFLEELIVRKELSDNFCFYNNRYDSLEGARDWAINSLKQHTDDHREFVYTLKQFESADTHDKAWNAAQTQLLKTGKIHGYMRMYWAKKILEWSENPKEAVTIANYLNDHYSVDGGDPNGYVGVLWSIAGLHDRPWFEREIFGKIRYMNMSGLKNKFDIESYIEAWLG